MLLKTKLASQGACENNIERYRRMERSQSKHISMSDTFLYLFLQRVVLTSNSLHFVLDGLNAAERTNPVLNQCLNRVFHLRTSYWVSGTTRIWLKRASFPQVHVTKVPTYCRHAYLLPGAFNKYINNCVCL